MAIYEDLAPTDFYSSFFFLYFISPKGRTYIFLKNLREIYKNNCGIQELMGMKTDE